MTAAPSASYSVALSEDGSFVHYRSMASARNAAEMGERLRAAIALGNDHEIRRILFDARGTAFEAGIAVQYEYAYHQAWRLGLTRAWRVGILVSPGDRSYDFLETAFVNSGYVARLFQDPARAADWLSGRADGGKARGD